LERQLRLKKIISISFFIINVYNYVCELTGHSRYGYSYRYLIKNNFSAVFSLYVKYQMSWGFAAGLGNRKQFRVKSVALKVSSLPVTR
jgi:hypothetical protein